MKKHLNFANTCGYITFLKTGVKDIGCEEDVVDVRLQRPQRRRSSVAGKGHAKREMNIPVTQQPGEGGEKRKETVGVAELLSPNDDVDISTFQRRFTSAEEEHFGTVVESPPSGGSPANEYRSADCNELLESELDTLSSGGRKLISEASIEIPIDAEPAAPVGEVYEGEDWTVLEVQFGVPLFDFDCNTRICQTLARSLLAEDK